MTSQPHHMRTINGLRYLILPVNEFHVISWNWNLGYIHQVASTEAWVRIVGIFRNNFNMH